MRCPKGDHVKHQLATGRRLMAAAAMVLCALGAGCGGDTTEPQPVPFNATAAELTEAGDVVSDAHNRLAGSLVDQTFAATLRPLLNTLNTHIAANRADRAAPALLAAQQALNGSVAPAADGPDRAAIRLALDHLERLLAR
jgi:hypothetical protein